MTDRDRFSFASLAARYARVPSGNGVTANSLDLALNRVRTAEENLESARAAARTAAKADGVKLEGLFSESRFVNRSWAERIADERGAESFQNGKEFAREEIIKIMMRSRGLDYTTEMRKIQTESAARMAYLNEEGARWRAKMKAAGFFAACDDGNYELAGRIYFEQFPEHFSPPSRRGDVARQILVAGAKARSTPGNDERPDPQGLAKMIVDSGRRRRGEID
jgi:hypothetical protein